MLPRSVPDGAGDARATRRRAIDSEASRAQVGGEGNAEKTGGARGARTKRNKNENENGNENETERRRTRRRRSEGEKRTRWAE